MEERLDKLLVIRNLVSTRTRAEQIIREYGVLVDDKLINRTGKKFPIDCKIELIEEEIPWVSRGAIKLLAAMKEWNPSVKGKVILDIGASTGGFTEVLLANGAKKVYCVDVGTDQLHEKIKKNNKIVNLEKTNVRALNTTLVPELVDACVIDVSFISLEKIFPFIHALLKENAFIIALVKPQFEVGKKNLGKGGIVRNKALLPEVINRIIEVGKQNKLQYQAHIDSPILGGDGNKEFLMLLIKK